MFINHPLFQKSYQIFQSDVISHDKSIKIVTSQRCHAGLRFLSVNNQLPISESPSYALATGLNDEMVQNMLDYSRCLKQHQDSVCLFDRQKHTQYIIDEGYLTGKTIEIYGHQFQVIGRYTVHDITVCIVVDLQDSSVFILPSLDILRITHSFVTFAYHLSRKLPLNTLLKKITSKAAPFDKLYESFKHFQASFEIAHGNNILQLSDELCALMKHIMSAYNVIVSPSTLLDNVVLQDFYKNKIALYYDEKQVKGIGVVYQPNTYELVLQYGNTMSNETIDAIFNLKIKEVTHVYQ